MAGATAPVQVGIFTNDLCIGYRIILHELLDNHVFRVFEAAKEIQQTRPKDSFRPMYERGMKSINSWDAQLKERYRAQVIAQYRQLTDLYHHIYLMYVQEMYDQSLDDVTVRVNIPALSTMLYMFLKLACNHQVILSGEYVTSMNFCGRVLFVETIIRRLLYELLVQQNNIKSISTTAPKSTSKRTAAKNPISVHSEQDMLSADMMMGTQRQPAPRLSADSDRFWMAPNSPSPAASLAGSEQSGGAVFGQNYQPRSSPVRTGSLLADLIPAPPVQKAAAPQKSKSISPSTVSSNVLPTFVSPTPQAVDAVSVSEILPNETDTALTGIKSGSEVSQAQILPNNVPRITSLQNRPIISGSVVEKTPSEQPAALFELRSQFTPHKPGGTLYPDANVGVDNRKDIQVDSLQLQPSDQDFAEEARRLLQDNNTDTLTPFDSVTNIANGDRRPPLFFETVRAAP